MIAVVDSPSCVTALLEVSFIPSAANIIQPDSIATSAVLVADVLTVVSDRTHPQINSFYSIITRICQK